MRLPLLVFGTALSLCVVGADGAELAGSPGVLLLEAEQKDANRASVTISSDPSASGGRFASATTDFHPLFNGDHPAVEAAQLSVWARVRGVAVQLKSINPDGTQTERKWSWEKPAAWKWVHLGTYDRAALGVGFVIIRGTGAAPDAGLDAVILSADPAFKPAQP